jgi:endogenous inhibitor of DNA gyrase (YacG/DUF329 family)
MNDNTPSMPSDTAAHVKWTQCPTCRKPVPWVEAEIYRPFCSRKCQLIDFGEWATERHSIPADTPPNADNIEEED